VCKSASATSKLRHPEPARRDHRDCHSRECRSRRRRSTSCRRGLPAGDPGEACYLGWQQSLGPARRARDAVRDPRECPQFKAREVPLKYTSDGRSRSHRAGLARLYEPAEIELERRVRRWAYDGLTVDMRRAARSFAREARTAAIGLRLAGHLHEDHRAQVTRKPSATQAESSSCRRQNGVSRSRHLRTASPTALRVAAAGGGQAILDNFAVPVEARKAYVSGLSAPWPPRFGNAGVERNASP